MNRVYLDHASCSPLRPEAARAMHDAIDIGAADPGRLHHEALAPREQIELARAQVAQWCSVTPRQVIFTSSATEANATVIHSMLQTSRGDSHPLRVTASAVEHSSITATLESRGFAVESISCDLNGLVDHDAFLKSLDNAPTLAVLQQANGEVGTVQPVPEIAAECERRGIPLLSDCTWSAPYLQLPPHAAYCSVDSATIGGPAGVGALILRRGMRVHPLLQGAAQERGRRAGLESTVAICGFGAAAQANTDEGRSNAGMRVSRLRKQLEAGLLHRDDVTIYGYGAPERLPNITSFAVHGIEAEPLLLALDQRGVAIHSGSACSSESLEPSTVLQAMGASTQHAICASLGWSSTESDVAQLLEALDAAVTSLRALRG